jgi:hypothetical protein
LSFFERLSMTTMDHLLCSFLSVRFEESLGPLGRSLLWLTGGGLDVLYTMVVGHFTRIVVYLIDKGQIPPEINMS